MPIYSYQETAEVKFNYLSEGEDAPRGLAEFGGRHYIVFAHDLEAQPEALNFRRHDPADPVLDELRARLAPVGHPLAREAILFPLGLSTRAHLLAAAEGEINNRHSAYLLALTGGDSAEERDTWDAKLRAAEAVLGQRASPTQIAMLAHEAGVRGITPEDLARQIITKAEAYLNVVGEAAARKIRAKSEIRNWPEAEVTPSAVRGLLDTVFALPEGSCGFPSDGRPLAGAQ